MVKLGDIFGVFVRFACVCVCFSCYLTVWFRCRFFFLFIFFLREESIVQFCCVDGRLLDNRGRGANERRKGIMYDGNIRCLKQFNYFDSFDCWIFETKNYLHPQMKNKPWNSSSLTELYQLQSNTHNHYFHHHLFHLYYTKHMQFIIIPLFTSPKCIFTHTIII